MLSKDQRVVHAPNVLATNVGDEAIVMMDVDTACYFGVEDVAADVWKLLANPCSVDDLVASLTQTYDVEPQLCHRETSEFVDRLLRAELLITVD